MDFITLTFTLFLIMDPIGNIPSFLKLMKDLPKKKKRSIIMREMLIALAIMILFNFIGESIFGVLNISDATLRLTTGTLLFLIAIKILFPASDSIRANLPSGEPFITPMAVPLIAGPSLLATIMLFAHLEPSLTTMLLAIFCAWLASVLVLLAGERIKHLLTENGLLAAERLTAMILVMLAVQRLLEGIKEFVDCC